MEIGLPMLLFIVFMILKLTGAIAWSWWWVTAPLWIAGGFGVIVLLFMALAYLFVGRSVARSFTRRFR